jgi:hypothetical protein
MCFRRCCFSMILFSAKSIHTEKSIKNHTLLIVDSSIIGWLISKVISFNRFKRGKCYFNDYNRFDFILIDS